jgi:hypothetical protein
VVCRRLAAKPHPFSFSSRSLVVHFVQIVSSLQEASLTIQDLLEQLNNARKGRKFWWNKLAASTPWWFRAED